MRMIINLACLATHTFLIGGASVLLTSNMPIFACALSSSPSLSLPSSSTTTLSSLSSEATKTKIDGKDSLTMASTSTTATTKKAVFDHAHTRFGSAGSAVASQSLSSSSSPAQVLEKSDHRNLQSRSAFCNDLEDAGELVTGIVHGGEFDCDCRSTSSRYYLECEHEGQQCCDDECFKVYRNFEFASDDLDAIKEEFILEYDGVHGDSTRQVVLSYCSRVVSGESLPCTCAAYIDGQSCNSCSVCDVEENGQTSSYAVEDCSNIAGFEFINYKECPSLDLYLTQDHKDGFICDDPDFIPDKSSAPAWGGGAKVVGVMMPQIIVATFLLVVASFDGFIGFF